MIKRGDFLEHAKVHSNYYGTSKDFVHQKIESGTSLLFDLDVQGADFFKKFFGSLANVIFIEPPSLSDLEKRLKKRGTDKDHVIEERLKNAKEELQRKNDFDYLVTNQDFDKAYEDLCRIFDQILKAKNV
jgi:guanylate kinase